jgi:hypothetical protein
MAFGTKNQDTVCVVYDNGDGKVIAAGPAHHINVEFLHPSLIRSVLIRDYGKYRVGIQRWDHDGEEFKCTGFTDTREFNENDYKDATKAFANLSLELAIGYPHLWH